MKKYNQYTNKKAMSTVFFLLPVLCFFCSLILINPLTVTAQKSSANKSKVIEHDKTNFPLEGKHRVTDCSECHLNGVMQGTPNQCEACHWQRKQDDRYRLQLGLHCDDCHTPFDWKILKPNSWEHQQVTGYALQGIHKTLDCFQCHKESTFVAQSNECWDCHQEDYRKADEPNHVSGNFPMDCTVCHTGMVSWEGATFNHAIFPLKGSHATADCTACHINGQYTGTTQDCSGCHLNDYNNTTNPNHQQAGYSTDCESCHGSDAVTWTGAVLDHTSFPLNGNHQTAACTACHINGQYAGTPRECSGCHLNDYNNTTNPNHQQAGYSTNCESCHGSDAVSWTGATVDHSAFPLKGNHLTAACTDCHVGGQYTGLSQECISCHQEEYNGTIDPNHQQAGFPTDCVPCHGTDALTWSNATFDHNQYYALEGAHRTLSCNTCHLTGYDLPTDCYGCHRQDYEKTTDPNHASAGFPTTCDSCHYRTHVTWNQAVFDHQFPITSGNHANISCTECHLTANYAVFSCIDCHEHNQNDMDNEHDDVGGYQYNSQACYSCHPTGRED